MAYRVTPEDDRGLVFSKADLLKPRHLVDVAAAARPLIAAPLHAMRHATQSLPSGHPVPAKKEAGELETISTTVDKENKIPDVAPRRGQLGLMQARDL